MKTEARPRMNEAVLEAGKFATTGRLDEAFFRRNMKHLVSRKYQVQVWAFRVLALVYFAMLGILLKQALFFLLGAVLLGLSFLVQAWRLRRMAGLQVKRISEIAPDGVLMMTTSFHEDGVHGRNETTGAHAVLPYEHIACLKESDEHLLLITRARQFQAVFKEQLEEKDVQDLKHYLKGKCPGIRM